MIKEIIIIFIILILIDILWLNFIKDKYFEQILQIQKKEMVINYKYALIVYLLLAFGLYYINKDNYDINNKLKNAALIGLVSYGVYDFTNAAIFEDWNIKIALLDTLWGTILCSSTIFIYNKLF